MRRGDGIIVRMEHVPAVYVAATLWLTLTLPVMAGEPFRKIKGNEITRRFAGQEFTDEVHWTYVFGKEGRLSSVSMGKEGSGRWRVDRDSLCLLPGSSPERCYEVWILGDRAQLREPGIEIYEEGVLQKPTSRQ